MTDQPRIAYEFGRFRMDPLERLMLHDGVAVPLTSKAFDTLLLLIRRRGRLVHKSEIMDTIWADSFVGEHNLVVTISRLRKVLTNGDGEEKCIETVAKQGYRFVGKVCEVAKPETELSVLPVEASPVLPEVFSRHRPLSSSFYIIGVLVLTCLAFSIVLVRSRKHSDTAGEIRSLAVLPLRTLNADAAHAYLSLGLADAIITKLVSTGQVIVRPTSAVVQYVDSTASPLLVGREQKVDAVLSGSVESLPNRIRITIQLVRVSDGSSLGADTFEEGTQQILELEDKVAERVSKSISVHFATITRAPAALKDTNNAEAYELYLRGRYFWSIRTEEGLRRSIEYLQQATTKDPQYARAYAGLADSYVLLASYGVESPQKAYPPARGAALNALRLDNSLAEAHASLGMIAFYYGWNWSESEQEFQQALALNSNDVGAETWYGLDLAAMGRVEEAVDLVQRAKEIDPLSPEINVVLGHLYYSSRQYEKAINVYRNVIQLNPNFARAHMRLGMTYMAQHALGDSIHEYKEAKRLAGADPYVDGLLGCAEALSGNTAAAYELLKELTLRSRDQYIPAFSIAMVYVGLGERDRALEWLERAYQDRSAYMVYAKTDPLLDPVRSDPRFISLLHRMRLL
jgi:DNA-binding winged helix-turn-helix (wHTH) protein/TolB-like protein/Flp pilus assembly protein TadD